MILIEGKKISERILKELKDDIRNENLKPGLGVVLVGKDEASKIYVSLKEKAAKDVGINFQKFEFQEGVPEDNVLHKIEELNKNPYVHGIIVQLPLPGHLNSDKIISSIDPGKDADGFSENSGFEPVLPKAVIKILESIPIDTRRVASTPDKIAIILANSDIFGRKMKAALERKNIKADYVVAEKNALQYYSMLEKIKNADIVISATGKPKSITGKIIKEGAIIIDAGITRVEDKVVGDVDLKSVKNKASYITPVPGGVGPVTIACLLENVYLNAKKSL